MIPANIILVNKNSNEALYIWRKICTGAYAQIERTIYLYQVFEFPLKYDNHTAFHYMCLCHAGITSHLIICIHSNDEINKAL